MTTPSSSPIAEDRAAQTFASPPCTACHLPNSSASSSTKRGLCGSLRDLQRRVGPTHGLGTGLIGTRAGAVLADPGAAVPEVAAGAGTTAPDTAGPIDDPGTRAAVYVAVVAVDAHPALSAAVTVSTATAGAGIPVSAAVTVSIAAAGVRVPISAAAAISVAATKATAPISAAAAVPVAAAGAAVPVFAAAAISVAATDAGASPAGSPSASSLRSITSPAKGTPGATPCPAGPAAQAEGGTGVGPCPMPDCGTLPSIAAAEATSAIGPAASPTTPPLTAGGVAARPAKVDDTRSTFFGASGGTKFRGAALNNDNFIKNGSMPGKE
nr:antifreeze protein Maxi-like [Setaria viridis]